MQLSQRRCHCWKHCLKCCQGPQLFSLNLCNVSKTPPSQILIHPWEQKKAPGSEIGRVGGGEGDTTTILFFSQKGGVLPTLHRFNENHWRPLKAFPLKISDHVSGNGSSADIAASSHCGSTMKDRLQLQTCMNILNQFFF